MSKKPKMKDVDPNEAAKMLGLPVDEGETVSTEPTDDYNDSVPRADGADQPTEPAEKTAPATEPQDGEAEEPSEEEAKLTPEERRKLWQANFTKEQQRAKQLEEEAQKLRDERDLFRQIAYQNKLLEQTMRPAAPEVKPDPEPA